VGWPDLLLRMPPRAKNRRGGRRDRVSEQPPSSDLESTSGQLTSWSAPPSTLPAASGGALALKFQQLAGSQGSSSLGSQHTGSQPGPGGSLVLRL
jgi:hypothetical protein